MRLFFGFGCVLTSWSRGGSSIVKVPGDVPPARVYIFQPSSLAKGILFANSRQFSLGRGILLAILVEEISNFGNSCKET